MFSPLMKKFSGPHSDKTVSRVLQEYRRGQFTTTAIAEKYGITPSTITAWAKRAGLKLRKRGRRKMQVPAERTRQMYELAKELTLAEVGRRFGVTKQAVHSVVCCWKHRLETGRRKIPG